MLRNLWMFLTLLTISAASYAEGLIIVANTADTDLSIKKREVRDLFMGNNSNIELTPIALAPTNPTRLLLNTKVVGLTEARIQSYWAQMRFSGRNKPPQAFDSIEAAVEFLLANNDTVLYLPADYELPEGLIVIYRSE